MAIWQRNISIKIAQNRETQFAWGKTRLDLSVLVKNVVICDDFACRRSDFLVFSASSLRESGSKKLRLIFK